MLKILERIVETSHILMPIHPKQHAYMAGRFNETPSVHLWNLMDFLSVACLVHLITYLTRSQIGR